MCVGCAWLRAPTRGSVRAFACTRLGACVCSRGVGLRVRAAVGVCCPLVDKTRLAGGCVRARACAWVCACAHVCACILSTHATVHVRHVCARMPASVHAKPVSACLCVLPCVRTPMPLTPHSPAPGMALSVPAPQPQNKGARGTPLRCQRSGASVAKVYEINSYLSGQWVKSEPSFNQLYG